MTATRTGRPPEPGLETASVEEQIIRMATLSYERLPMMEVIFDRFALSLGGALKSFSAAPTEVTLDAFEYMSCNEALESLPAPWLVAVSSAKPWEGSLALVIDPDLLFTMLETMLGGRGAEKAGWVPRSFTSIEKRLATRLCEVALRELTEAFANVAEVRFSVDHLENSPHSTVLAPPRSACVKITLDVSVEGRGGKLVLVIPNMTFEPARALLAQTFLGGQIGGDSSWQSLLTESLQDTSVDLVALLHELKLPLAEVLGWRPGDVLDLGIDTEAEVTVNVSGKKMFHAAMGRRRNGSVALRVTRTLNGKDGLPHDGTAD
ncbi:FliM/FliN family flagellar motor switch protein [Actibacterium sp. MT2.3-13A]|uniref:flagellar motor switch protein FliM n=1 Tax=Actibacterium sp. MT2.3-13A TaxID=2828332 RepID=UPI001BA9254F|nr:FliM/FliN family flagellar motor switch protein [Actibacterium sp. MT2.3-13A]